MKTPERSRTSCTVLLPESNFDVMDHRSNGLAVKVLTDKHTHTHTHSSDSMISTTDVGGKKMTLLISKYSVF